MVRLIVQRRRDNANSPVRRLADTIESARRTAAWMVRLIVRIQAGTSLFDLPPMPRNQSELKVRFVVQVLKLACLRAV